MIKPEFLPPGSQIVAAPVVDGPSRPRRYIWSCMPIGDSLAIAHLLDDGGAHENWILANRYNAGVCEFLLSATTLNLAGYVVLPFDSPATDEEARRRSVSGIAPELLADGILRWPTFSDFGLKNLPLRPGALPCSLPQPRITVQPDSVSSWKAIPGLFEVQFGRAVPDVPVYSLGQGGERGVPGTHVLQGLRLIETAAVIAGAWLHVGICSSLAWLAPMLGTPSLICHIDEGQLIWGVTKFGAFTRVKRPGNRDLLRPRAAEIEAALKEALLEGAT
jgi:hypothetical protein